MGQKLSVSLGVSWHLPSPGAIPSHPGDQLELSSLTGSGAWGDAKKFHSDWAYLLVLPKKATKEEMVFGLAMVWVHPYQAHIPTLDEVSRKLSLLTASHKNLAYAFVRFNEDA